MIPLVDLSAVNTRQVRDCALQRIATIGQFGEFVDGSEVQQFEERWADYVGARYCVGVANGTDALELAIRGVWGADPVEALRVPALTFVATAEAVVRAGEAVALVDVDESLLCRGGVDIQVGLYGQPVPIVGGKRVVDAAQMHGLKLPGRTASWSFYPTKNLGAWGDAGAVTTDDEGLADGIRELARHGGGGRTGVGFNSRLDTIQAAVLIEKLHHLDEWVEARRQIAGSYRRRLVGSGLLVVGGPDSVFHQIVVRIANGRRPEVRALMRSKGIETGVHYGVALSEMGWLDPFREGLALGFVSRPVAEQAAREVLSLPCWPGMMLSTIDQVSNVLMESVEEAEKEQD